MQGRVQAVLLLVCRYLVDTVSISGHRFGKNKEWILLIKFINHIDNTLHYKSQVEQSIQMSYSKQVLYQNAAATRTCGAATRACDAATTMLPSLQLTAAAEAGCYVIECYQASSMHNVM